MVNVPSLPQRQRLILAELSGLARRSRPGSAMLLWVKCSVQEFGRGQWQSGRSSMLPVATLGDMARPWNIVYLLSLLTLVVVGLVWDAPTGVKVLVGGAAMVPVVVADVMLWRRRRAVRVADIAR